MDAGAIDLDRQLALNRVLGSSMSRVAPAAIAAFVEALDAEDGMGTASELDDLDLSQIIQAMRLTLPMLDRTIGLVWRRHLASAARRAVLAAALTTSTPAPSWSGSPIWSTSPNVPNNSMRPTWPPPWRGLTTWPSTPCPPSADGW